MFTNATESDERFATDEMDYPCSGIACSSKGSGGLGLDKGLEQFYKLQHAVHVNFNR